MLLRRALTIALGAAALGPAAVSGQTVSLALDALRDDIPSTHQRWALRATTQAFSRLYLTLGARSLHVDQEPFNGIAAVEERLQTGFGEAAMLLGNGALTVGTALNRADDGGTYADYLVRAQYAVLLGAGPGAVTATFTLHAAREREVSVATALAERISYERVGGGLDLNLGQRASAAARLDQDRYSDGNRKTAGYAYGLIRLVRHPDISVGYAFAFADAQVDHWRATGTTQDPATGVYEYQYFYYPYFTPMEERGHSGLAAFLWSSDGGATLSTSANVPVSSRGLRQSVARWDTTPEPPPMYGYHTADGMLPLQVRMSASAPLLPGLAGTARYEYFRKSYYSYQSGGLSLQFTF